MSENKFGKFLIDDRLGILVLDEDGNVIDSNLDGYDYEERKALLDSMDAEYNPEFKRLAEAYFGKDGDGIR